MYEIKWKDRTCDICGIGSKTYISVCIQTENEDNDYPYTETNLCRDCFNKLGVQPAFDHNREINEYCENEKS